MKNIIKMLFILLISIVGNAQINTPALPAANIAGENPFLDLSEYSVGAPLGFGNSEGKGLVFPSTDLTAWEFNTAGLGAIFPTSFDGMIVYNTGAGTTGGTPATQGVQVNVVPGFYYFSNPDGALGANSVETGRWLAIGTQGGATGAVKSKTVQVVSTIESAEMNLGSGSVTGFTVTDPIADNEVKQLIGAKIYTGTAPDLVLVTSAITSYNKATNILTIGNGMIYQAIPAGSYTVVVEYK